MENFWWSLPTWLTACLKPLTKTTKKWSFTCYKGSKDWYFNLPLLLTFKESLTGGTEKCLDWWYEEMTGFKPQADCKMKLELSKYPMPGCSTKLTFMFNEGCDGSSFYKDAKSQMMCWLCPYLPYLMDGKPDTLYLNLQPLM